LDLDLTESDEESVDCSEGEENFYEGDGIAIHPANNNNNNNHTKVSETKRNPPPPSALSSDSKGKKKK